MISITDITIKTVENFIVNLTTASAYTSTRRRARSEISQFSVKIGATQQSEAACACSLLFCCYRFATSPLGERHYSSYVLQTRGWCAYGPSSQWHEITASWHNNALIILLIGKNCSARFCTPLNTKQCNSVTTDAALAIAFMPVYKQIRKWLEGDFRRYRPVRFLFS